MSARVWNYVLIFGLSTLAILTGCVSDERIEKMVEEEVQSLRIQLRSELDDHMLQNSNEMRKVASNYMATSLNSISALDRKTETAFDEVSVSMETQWNNLERVWNALMALCYLEYSVMNQGFFVHEYMLIQAKYFRTGDDSELLDATERIQAGLSAQDYNSNSQLCTLDAAGEFQFREQ